MLPLALAFALLALAESLSLNAAARPMLARAQHVGRASQPICAADDDEPLSLEAAFQERLNKEGGATQFKLKTDAAKAAETVRDSVAGVTSKVAEKVDGLLDAGSGRPKSDGLLDQDQWKLTVGFFAVLIVLSVGNAVLHSGAPPDSLSPLGTSSVDMFTSDGQALQFGRQ